MWLSLVFACIAYLFWKNEYVYSLPTPVPIAYVPVKTGEPIRLTDNLVFEQSKPVFLHFFNPSCPCSRFNISHVKSLFRKYQDRVSFVVVVMNSTANYTEEEIQDKFDFNVPVLFEPSVAKACGVYSTPQAAILTAQHKLYYRGNYNKSRYCTNKDSYYAQNALDSLLQNVPSPQFSALATTAYGCTLPFCEKPKTKN